MKKFACFIVFLSVLAATLGVLPAWSSRSAWGQGISYQNLATKKSELTSKLASGELSGEDRQSVERYFQNYELGRWTITGREVNIPEYREQLLATINQVLSANENSGKLVLGFVLQGLQKLATNAEISPTVKYNAILMAGELVEKRDGSLMTPYALAHDFLLKVYNGKTPPYMKVAAMIGLRLHVERNLPTAKKQALVPIFAKEAFTPWRQRESAETTWMRELSIEALGLLRVAGPNSTYAEQLFDIVSGTAPGYPLETRLAAAVAASRISQTGKNKPKDVYEQIAKLTAEALGQEFTREVILKRGVLPGQAQQQPRASASRVRPGYGSPEVTMPPEENRAMVRSFQQRTLMILDPMYAALNVNTSTLGKALSSGDQEWARDIMKDVSAMTLKMKRVGAAPKRATPKTPDSDSFVSSSYAKEPEYQNVKDDFASSLTSLYRKLKLPTASLQEQR